MGELGAGSAVGEYELVRPIGEGGMGIVYEAVNPVIKKRVAIKVLKADPSVGEAEQERLIAEAQAVNAIGHRSLVGVFGAGTLPDGRRYLVMEYLDGEPLDVYLAHAGPLSPLETCQWLQEICGPLHAAHLHGVVHRDLKPGNVFVVKQADERFLKLLDFGLARRGITKDNDLAQTRDLVVQGSPDYMAPEQCTNTTVSARTDLYALGSIAYEMLVGRAPFRDDEAPVIDVMMRKVKRPAPRVPDTVPAPLADLVAALLERDPLARPASADRVRAQLKRIARMIKEGGDEIVDTSETARPSGPLALPAAARARRTVPLMLGLAIMVLGVAAVAAAVAWLVRPAVRPPPVVIAVPAVAQEPEPVTEPTGAVEPVDESESEALPTLPTVRRPSPPPPPSQEDVQKRLASMEARFQKRPTQDPAGTRSLNSFRVRVTVIRSPAERSALLREFVAWEKQYLR